ncbi:hypothetical protein Taro_009586 [Colocasia esculenta]|uniref:Reverse transcriptase domain-containing protein n=1 Tax=Colocasia esculenta TaxID=4460 RepID=A0A843U634_COLES|nr:hypothetical protein [Colocasia esculenta]
MVWDQVCTMFKGYYRSSTGYFKSSRGLRQGDHIAPALFIIMEEALSRGIKNMVDSGYLLPYSGPRRCPPISHLLYADDTLVFLNGSIRNVRRLMDFLNKYAGSSGQFINSNKSCFMLADKVATHAANKIKEVTSYSRKMGSLNYLGVPLKPGRLKSADYCSLIDKVDGKFKTWKSKLLSQAGRITLINSVISSLPIYLVAASCMPKSIITYIERASAAFFWDDADGVHRRHWVAWSKIQRPIMEGGPGVDNETRNATLNEVVSNASQPLRSVIPHYIMDGLTISSEEDRCLWAPTNNGSFTTHSCAGHQQWVGVQVCDVYCVLAAMVLPLTVLGIHRCRRRLLNLASTGARGKAVMCAAAADQAGNDGLEGGVCGKLLGRFGVNRGSIEG